MIRTTLTLASLTLAGAAMAGSYDASPTAEAIDFGYTETEFAELDTDDNGAISRQEADANRVADLRFNEADENRNGKLSRSEYAAIAYPPGEDEVAE